MEVGLGNFAAYRPQIEGAAEARVVWVEREFVAESDLTFVRYESGIFQCAPDNFRVPLRKRTLPMAGEGSVHYRLEGYPQTVPVTESHERLHICTPIYVTKVPKSRIDGEPELVSNV